MKLALGTAQFGFAYGVANRVGQVALTETKAILQLAKSHGMDVLDTAMSYGDSEQRLGEVGVKDWQVISKLPPIPSIEGGINEWIFSSVRESLGRLHINHLDGLLLHRPDQLLGAKGEEIYRSLRQIKRDGLVKKIGVSIYDPKELDRLTEFYEFDLVQAPFNLLDNRLIKTGWMSKMRSYGIELHVRSVFLQGLLLMPKAERSLRFSAWNSVWNVWDEWLDLTGLTALQACLTYAIQQPEISRVVIGVENCKQLAGIITAVDRVLPILPELPELLHEVDVGLLNPSNWPNPSR